jgi:hypothetical protein
MIVMGWKRKVSRRVQEGVGRVQEGGCTGRGEYRKSQNFIIYLVTKYL